MHAMKEISQPNLAIPDENDPFSWASLSRVQTLWYREVGPQLELDAHLLVIGDVLGSIIGDDYGTLGPRNIIVGNKEIADASKAMLLERMDWEAHTTEMPDYIRQKIKAVSQQIAPLNWEVAEEYEQAKSIWKSMKSWIEAEIERDPYLKAALEYSLAHSAILSPYWQAFLGYWSKDYLLFVSL